MDPFPWGVILARPLGQATYCRSTPLLRTARALHLDMSERLATCTLSFERLGKNRSALQGRRHSVCFAHHASSQPLTTACQDRCFRPALQTVRLSKALLEGVLSLVIHLFPPFQRGVRRDSPITRGQTQNMIVNRPTLALVRKTSPQAGPTPLTEKPGARHVQKPSPSGIMDRPRVSIPLHLIERSTSACMQRPRPGPIVQAA